MKAVIKDEAIKRVMGKIRQRYGNFSEPMKNIALLMKSDVLSHFDEEMGPDGKWPNLAQSTKQQKIKKKGTAYPILVFTGRLKKSIHARSGKFTATVYTGVKYAAYHQFGTRKMPKRPFLWLSKKAVENIISEIKRWLRSL